MERSLQVTMDRAGRIVLPKSVRDELGLRGGDVLRLERDADGLVLRLLREAPELERRGTVLVFVGRAIADLTDAVPRDRDARARALTGR